MFEPNDTPLPALYGRWIQQLLDADVPEETRATCAECVMCPREGHQVVGPYPFRPDVKCCVYMPELPNFLVGMILADDDPEMAFGRQTLEERLEARVAVTPLGVGQPPRYKLAFDKTVNALGRSTELRCPHFRVSDGACGIWKYRDHTCSTFFCKHDRGQLGQRFWRSTKAWLKAVERSLAAWCVAEEELDASTIGHLFAPEEGARLDASEIDQSISDLRHQQIWGALAGDTRAFFQRCADRVKDLSWAEVQQVTGPETRALSQLVRASRSALDTPIPERLRVGTYQLLGVNNDGIRALTYAPTDAVDVPHAVTGVLHYFDGRPTEEILQALEEERGIRIHEDLLRELVDYGLLLDAT